MPSSGQLAAWELSFYLIAVHELSVNHYSFTHNIMLTVRIQIEQERQVEMLAWWAHCSAVVALCWDAPRFVRHSVDTCCQNFEQAA